MSQRRLVTLLFGLLLVLNTATLLFVGLAPRGASTVAEAAAADVLKTLLDADVVVIDPEQRDVRYPAPPPDPSPDPIPGPNPETDPTADPATELAARPQVSNAVYAAGIARDIARPVNARVLRFIVQIALFIVVNTVFVLAAGYFTLYHVQDTLDSLPPSRSTIIVPLTLLLLLNGFGALTIPAIEISSGVALHLAAVNEIEGLVESGVMLIDHDKAEQHYHTGSSTKPPVLIALDMNGRVTLWPYGPRLVLAIVLNTALALVVFYFAIRLCAPTETWSIAEEERFDPDGDEEWELGRGQGDEDGYTWGPDGDDGDDSGEWELGQGMKDDDDDDDGWDPSPSQRWGPPKDDVP